MVSKSVLARNAACDAIVSLLDTTGVGSLNMYTSDSTVIVSLPLSNPAFAASVDGTANSYPIYDATALIDGTAEVFWMLDGSGNQVYGGSITNTAGDGDLRINSTIIPQDTTVAISSASFVVPT